jgi:hypothetical protein
MVTLAIDQQESETTRLRASFCSQFIKILSPQSGKLARTRWRDAQYLVSYARIGEMEKQLECQ